METPAHTAIQEKKIKAVEITQRLDIYKPYIEYFRKKDRFVSLKTSAASGCTKSRKQIANDRK